MKTMILICSLALLAACRPAVVVEQPAGEKTMSAKIQKSDAEWKAQLTPEAYEVLREAGTERPGSGAYLHHA